MNLSTRIALLLLFTAPAYAQPASTQPVPVPPVVIKEIAKTATETATAAATQATAANVKAETAQDKAGDANFWAKVGSGLGGLALALVIFNSRVLPEIKKALDGIKALNLQHDQNAARIDRLEQSGTGDGRIIKTLSDALRDSVPKETAEKMLATPVVSTPENTTRAEP